MCTVTYIPFRDSVYITSNRDEKRDRPVAMPPAVYSYTSGRVLFPKDGGAGGTWIAAHENGNSVVFLNGAFQSHQPVPPYRKSRGLILLDLIDHSTPFNCFLAVKLNNIEPFTAVIRDNRYLFECRWDGVQKHYVELNSDEAYLWSSATLYNEQAAEKRNGWFKEWMNKNPEPSRQNILHFHQFTGEDGPHDHLLMNRDGKVFTVSITSLHISPGTIRMDYHDLQSQTRSADQIEFETSMAGR